MSTSEEATETCDGSIRVYKDMPFEQLLDSREDIADCISKEHGVTNTWTTHRGMHYCYEQDVWCHFNWMWDAHLYFQHFQCLNDFYGLLKECGVAVVVAHYLFYLRDIKLLSARFAQYHGVFDLRKHMKGNLTGLGTPKVCPHPICRGTLDSKSDFQDHATSVHDVPSCGPRRITGKRKSPEDSVGYGAGDTTFKRKVERRRRLGA